MTRKFLCLALLWGLALIPIANARYYDGQKVGHAQATQFAEEEMLPAAITKTAETIAVAKMPCCAPAENTGQPALTAKFAGGQHLAPSTWAPVSIVEANLSKDHERPRPEPAFLT